MKKKRQSLKLLEVKTDGNITKRVYLGASNKILEYIDWDDQKLSFVSKKNGKRDGIAIILNPD